MRKKQRSKYALDYKQDESSHFHRTGEIDGDQTRDHQILCSIINDGHYDISSEDRAALESVIASFYTPSRQEATMEL